MQNNGKNNNNSKDAFIIDDEYKDNVLKRKNLFDYLSSDGLKRVIYPENELQKDTGKTILRLINEFSFYHSFIFDKEKRTSEFKKQVNSLLEDELPVNIIKFIIDKNIHGITPSNEEIIDYGLKNCKDLTRDQLLARLYFLYNLTIDFNYYNLMEKLYFYCINNYPNYPNNNMSDLVSYSINSVKNLWNPNKIEINTEEQLTEFSDFVEELHILLKNNLENKHDLVQKK